jgi:hypothetical protein
MFDIHIIPSFRYILPTVLSNFDIEYRTEGWFPISSVIFLKNILLLTFKECHSVIFSFQGVCAKR